jgi:hypothetical protein
MISQSCSSTLEVATIVDTALTRASKVLWLTAHEYDLEMDDLRQEAALIVIETLKKRPELLDADYLFSYLYSTIRNQMRVVASRHKFMSSLDAYLGGDECEENTPLGLLLMEPPPHNTSRTDRLITTVHRALEQLPLDEQQHLRRVYALNAYQPTERHIRVRKGRKIGKDRKQNIISGSALYHLRHDAQLASEVLS